MITPNKLSSLQEYVLNRKIRKNKNKNQTWFKACYHYFFEGNCKLTTAVMIKMIILVFTADANDYSSDFLFLLALYLEWWQNKKEGNDAFYLLVPDPQKY